MSSRRVLVLCTVAASVTLGATTPAGAVALRPNKSTDDTVCDLTHHTNAYLGSKTLVPSVASSNDQIDAYFRLAAQFITSNCRDGQLLMLQGNASSSIDTRSLNEVASSACTIASVARSDVTLTGGGMTRPGFELRCTIVKQTSSSRSSRSWSAPTRWSPSRLGCTKRYGAPRVDRRRRRTPRRRRLHRSRAGTAASSRFPASSTAARPATSVRRASLDALEPSDGPIAGARRAPLRWREGAVST